MCNKIEELKRLAEAATPGPWQLAENDDTIVITEWLDKDGDAYAVADVLFADRGRDEPGCANAAFIAAANPATILSILERLERAEKALEASREHIEGFCAIVEHCSVTDGSCCCGEDMARHSNPMDCGHSPVDHGSYAADNAHRAAKDWLAALSGATS